MNGALVDDLLTFACVVEAGGFAAAAKVLGQARSTPGKAIARLEDRHGTRLLNRTTRALSLTETGRTLYAHALHVRATLAEVDASLAEADDPEPRGLLRIAAPDALGRRLILPAVQTFMERWPEVRVDLSLSDRLSGIVDEGFDLAIRLGATDPDAGLIARRLRTERLTLVAAPEYLDRTGRPQRIEQLGRHDLLIHASGDGRLTWHLQDRDGTRSRVSGRVRLRLDSGDALREAAIAGMGVALLPETLVAPDVVLGHLEQLLPHIDAGSLPLMALYAGKRQSRGTIRQFIDHVAASLRG